MAGAACLVQPRALAQGLGFQAPRALNDNASGDSGDDRQVRFARGMGGAWMAAWASSEPLANSGGGDFDIALSRSADEGLSWGAPFVLQKADLDGASPDAAPAIATDGAGNWIVAWESEWAGEVGDLGTDADIFFARSASNGQAWGEPFFLNTNARTDHGTGPGSSNPDRRPEIATDGSGVWVAAWTLSPDPNVGGALGTDQDILFSRSLNNGASWSAPQPLNLNSAGDDAVFDRAPALLADGTGVWIACWEFDRFLTATRRNAGVAMARSFNGGQTWSEPLALDVALDTQDVFMLETALAADGAGNWIAAWTSNRDDTGGGFDIWTARSSSHGVSWTEAQRFDPGGLGQGSASDQAPSLASNGAGEWRMAWTERDFGPASQRWTIKASRSLDNGATWGLPQTLDAGEALFFGAAPETLDPAPAIGLNGSGEWLASWTSFKRLCSDDANGDADIAFSVTGDTGGEAPASRFSNISTRGRVGVGDEVMIAGFIIEGTEPKTVLINGRGPSLAPFGVPDVLANPTLRLFSGQTEIDFNDNWRGRPANVVAAIEATGRAPADDFEAALLPTLAPGSYTVHMAGVFNGQGNGLVEVWDQSPASASRLSNISTRGLVGSGDDVMIAGFIIEGTAPKTVLVNGLGPTLAPFGVPDVLANPTLRLFNGSNQFSFNDNWTALSNADAILATGRAPTDGLEAATLLSLPPGTYTAHLAGANDGAGNGLIELWEEDAPFVSECDDGTLLPRPAPLREPQPEAEKPLPKALEGREVFSRAEVRASR